MITAAVTLAVSHAALASSHREAPGITAMPKVDGTDLYIFDSYEPGRDDYVTLIANYLPLQDAYGGPNYFSLDPDALYEILIDNDGNAVEDITFQFRFTNELGGDGGAALDIGGQMVKVPLKAVGPIESGDSATANFSESYTLDVITGDRRSGERTAVTAMTGGATSFAKPLDYIGEKTFPDYPGYLRSLTGSDGIYYDVDIAACTGGATDGRLFVGQRKDPFAVNLGRIFDLINLNPLAALDAESADNDDLADKNVTTLALEVPKSCLTAGGDSTVIGAWTTASKRQVSVLDPAPAFGENSVDGGAWTQVSRLGAPLVNELVIGLGDKDLFNASEPKDDGTGPFGLYVTNPTLPALIDALFRDAVGATASIAPSNLPRNDLVAAFLTGFPGVNQIAAEPTASEMLRLNTAVPATPLDSQVNLGVAAGDLAGFPNGRRPGDDVVDIALRVVMGALCHPLPLDADASGDIAEGGENLGLCTPEQAPVGTAALNDGVPQNAQQFDAAFPYLKTPLPGATTPAAAGN